MVIITNDRNRSRNKENQCHISYFRYELVPKKVREDEFWRNYFYRVSLIKQSFDLKDFETENSTVTNQQNSRTENIQPSNNVAEEEVVDHHLNKYEPLF